MAPPGALSTFPLALQASNLTSVMLTTAFTIIAQPPVNLFEPAYPEALPCLRVIADTAVLTTPSKIKARPENKIISTVSPRVDVRYG